MYELSALEMGIRRALREGAATEARALETLRNRVIALHPVGEVLRAEADAEATLQARGHTCRPGPHSAYDPEILEVIDLALKGPFKLEITYLGEQADAPCMRTVEPYGVLFGLRCYLVCRVPDADKRTRHLQIDRILKARRLNESFARDQEFDLHAHAARTFGSFDSETEFGTVIWRFNKRAAPFARDYVFHPNQIMQDDQDGGLIVSFEAGGWLEMAGIFTNGATRLKSSLRMNYASWFLNTGAVISPHFHKNAASSEWNALPCRSAPSPSRAPR